MANTITAVSAVYTLSIQDLFTAPVQLQGFSADNIFGTEALASAEVLMGLDGKLSAGFVHAPVVQNIELQADSLSNDVFEQWWLEMQVNQDAFYAQGVVFLTSVSKKWAMQNGILTSYAPVPDAARTLRPRRYVITWEFISPAPV
jgi:hypothetical protein